MGSNEELSDVKAIGGLNNIISKLMFQKNTGKWCQIKRDLRKSEGEGFFDRFDS